MWETGAARISRHPQMVGQLLWCAAHTAYVGTSFTCTVSALLCSKNANCCTVQLSPQRNDIYWFARILSIFAVYHIFGAWHGDQRLRQRFGAEAEAYFARTSVVPLAAVLQGRQRLPADYYREFLRVPYLVVLAVAALVYELHPLMLQQTTTLSW
jgi:zeta-carotene isomerase